MFLALFFPRLDSVRDEQKCSGGFDNSDQKGMLYGDIGESLELQPIQNPYYDKEVKVTSLNSKVTSSPDPNDIEAITTTKNIYYDI